jgi:hypothetical protein
MVEIAKPAGRRLLIKPLIRRRMSLAAGPRSARKSKLFDGRLNGLSASFVFFISRKLMFQNNPCTNFAGPMPTINR